jgi:ADP-ribose pyrophosphatase YjhB (NUDIX family)
MALEKLQFEIFNSQQVDFCEEKVSPSDAATVIQGLQMLIRIRGNERGKIVLSDPLFPIIFSKCNMHIDSVFYIAKCILKKVENEKVLVPIAVKRREFKVLKPTKEPQFIVEPASNVQLLARNPVAKMNVCGWESDHWFLSPKGAKFIDFWNSTHEDLPCLSLPKDEQVVAVLFFGLQTILHILEDETEQFHFAFDTCKTKEQQLQVYSQILQEMKDVLEVCEFLPQPLEHFADAYEIQVEKTWEAVEDIYLASNGNYSTEELQYALSTCSFYRSEFILFARKIKLLANKLLQWKEKPSFEDIRTDKKEYLSPFKVLDSLYYHVNQTYSFFCYLNKSSASLPSLIPLPSEYDGLVNRIYFFKEQLQKPFRGTFIEKEKNADYTVEMISIPFDLRTMQTWEEVEDYLLATRKQSKGAGIAFLLNKRILLPLSKQNQSIEDKWIGGRVEANESWIDAAWREFDEETFVRSDPWVDEFKTTTQNNFRKVYLDDEKEYKWMQLDELNCKTGTAFLVAVENGIQIERHIKCGKDYTKKRMNTRELFTNAFNNLSKEKKYAYLSKFKLLVEKADGGRKTYQTLCLDLEPLLYEKKITSIVKIPITFPLYASQISQCSQACFQDVFVQEKIDLDIEAMNNNEHPGFEWVRFDDDRIIRIKKALKLYY